MFPLPKLWPLEMNADPPLESVVENALVVVLDMATIPAVIVRGELPVMLSLTDRRP